MNNISYDKTPKTLGHAMIGIDLIPENRVFRELKPILILRINR